MAGVLAALALLALSLLVAWHLLEAVDPEAGRALDRAMLLLVGWFSAQTALFHVLAATGTFRLPVALVAWVVLLVPACHLSGRPWLPVERLREDLRRLRELRLPELSPIERLLLGALGVHLVLAALRGLLLPPFTWDSLTYHLVHAAGWVQEGGWFRWAAPDGWTLFELLPAGGEVPHAWAMLACGGDQLAGLVGLPAWLMLVLAAHRMLADLGAGGRSALLGAAMVGALPPAFQVMQSAEVDLYFAACALSAAALGGRALAGRAPGRLVPAGAALGLAAGVKTTGLALVPVAVLAAGWALIGGRLPGRTVALAAVAGALLAAPWPLRSWKLVGSPTWPVPIEVGGREVFPGSPQLAVTLAAVEAEAAALRAQGEGLPQLLGIYLGTGSRALGPPVALALLGLLPGLLLAYRRRPVETVWALAMAVALSAAFFSPRLAGARWAWAGSYGRLMLMPAALALVLAIAGACRDGELSGWRRGLAGLLLAGQLLRLSPWGGLHQNSLGTFQLFLPVLAWLLLRLRLSPRRAAWAALIGGLLAVPLRPRLRYPVLRELSSPRYMRVAAGTWQRLDRPSRPLRLAVAGGYAAYGMAWPWYPLLGRELQNRMEYVPITSDGSLVSYREPARLAEVVDPPAWLRRLWERGMEVLVCLPPTSPELHLARGRPDLFEPLTEGHLPAFRVRRDRLKSLLTGSPSR